MDTQEMNNTQDTTPEALPMKLDVGVRPIVPKGNLVAFASVKINDCFVVDGIKIVTGEKGSFVDMPSAPDGKGGYQDEYAALDALMKEHGVQTPEGETENGGHVA